MDMFMSDPFQCKKRIHCYEKYVNSYSLSGLKKIRDKNTSVSSLGNSKRSRDTL